MKKAFLFTALVAAAVLVVMVPAAHAADGTLNFTGNITANSCVINSNAPNLTINLGDVPASALATAGERAGQTPFEIVLTGCTGEATKVAAKFEADIVDVATGHLPLDPPSSASEVQIAVYDGTGTDNKFGQQPEPSAYRTLANGTATLRYNAWYVATGLAMPGSANAHATYTLSYQ